MKIFSILLLCTVVVIALLSFSYNQKETLQNPASMPVKKTNDIVQNHNHSSTQENTVKPNKAESGSLHQEEEVPGYMISSSVKEHYLLALALGGWDKWLEQFKSGIVSIDSMSQAEKDDLFGKIVKDLEPAVIDELVNLGFQVPLRAFYDVIVGGKDMAEQEVQVLAKLQSIAKYADIAQSGRQYSFQSYSLYDRAISFGYLDVIKHLDTMNIKPLNTVDVYRNLLKGRQPSIAAVQYLSQAGHIPPKNLIDLAIEANIDARNPALFSYLQRMY